MKNTELFLVGGGKLAELGYGGRDNFQRGRYFLWCGVATEAETNTGAGVFGGEADGG